MAEKFTEKSKIEQLAALSKVEGVVDKYMANSKTVLQVADRRSAAIKSGTYSTADQQDAANFSSQVDLANQIDNNQKLLDTILDDPNKSYYNEPRIVAARERVYQAQNSLRTKLTEVKEQSVTQVAYTPPEPTITRTATTDIDNSPNSEQFSGGEVSEQELSNLNNPEGIEAGETVDEPNRIDENTETDVSTGTAPASDDEAPTQIAVPIITVNPSEPDIDISTPLKNPLHSYASYTYGLSLHLLTAEEYNKIVSDGEYRPNRVLIASAGRYNNTPGESQFIRSPYFKEDFYFDRFNLETVIGLNAASRNSNAVNYDFTLVEPYGFTLIDRIIAQCNDPSINCNNYLDMPYLLQIDFFGINDQGEIEGKIPNTTKRIPIRLNQIDVNITERGTEYHIKGSPYGHSAFDLSTITTPANFEVQARTVGQFFSATEQSSVDQTKVQRETAQNSLYQTSEGKLVSNGQFVNTNELNSALLSLQTRIEIGLVKSYGTALNNWQKAAYDTGKIGANDKYFFKFLDKEIENSPFTSGPLSTPKDTGMSTITRTDSIKKSNLGANTNDYDPNLRIFQVNAGTYIDRVISWVIRNSQWMTDQISIPDGVADPEVYLQEQASKKNQPLWWFKVIPSVRLIKFDNVRKVWSREITYFIQKYRVENVKVDVGPQGTTKVPVKAYNYIYTGKNDDILDLDIKFNALYYNALTIYRNNLTKVVPPATATEEKIKDNPDNYKGSNQDPNAIMPLVMKPVTLDASGRASGGSITAKQVAVADLEESLMTLSQADMMNVQLKIIGDPQFIKQDELFWTPTNKELDLEAKTNPDPRLTFDGSLIMDKGEVYVSLVFKTPVDIDESTGMLRQDGKTNISLFSGMYRVLTVKNEFSKGQFLQTLNLVRLVRQGNLDYTHNKVETSDNRNSVPGQQAVLDDYLQGPDFDVSDSPNNQVALDTDDQSQSGQDINTDEDVTDVDSMADQEELAQINDEGETQAISTQNEPASVAPPPNSVAPVAQLPDGVTQDRFGSYQYKGLNLPPGVEPGSAEFNRSITAIDNQQTIQVQAVNPSTGQTATREFNGDWKASNISRAENNVEFAESELKRFDQKVNSGFFDRNGQGISAETQAKLDAARERYVADVAAAKSTLSQAKQGKVVLAPPSQ